MLLTSQMRENLLTKSKRKYRYILVRIKFPDNIILQGTFRSSETGQSVLTFVESNLHMPLPFDLKSAGTGNLKPDEPLSNYAPSCLFNLYVEPSLLNDIQQQSGKIHLLSRDIMSKLETM